MGGRRALYLALLIGAAILHFAYGQYVTHYILLFLLIIPVLSVILALPTAIRARVDLIGGTDVCRGRKTSVRLCFDTFGALPPEGWRVTVASENLFTCEKYPKEYMRAYGERRSEKELSPNTSEIGCIRYKIKSAYVYDFLGLIPIPVKKGAPIIVTVYPFKEEPVPEPQLIARSAMELKPKPQGFAEEHELRPYRDGDPLNLIHWKLTAKYGGVVVREPQEEIRRPIVLILDIPILYVDHRSVLEQLCFVSEQLLEKQIAYSLFYGNKKIRIGSQNDFEEFLKSVLSKPMQTEKTELAFKTTEDELVYRIRPGRWGAR